MTPKDEELNRKLREKLAARKQHFPTSEHLQTAFERSRDALLAEARRHFPAAEVLNAGPDLDERSGSWSAIVAVDTDEAKRAIQDDELLMRRLQLAAKAGGFAPYELAVESAETVQRDYKGNWFNRWKA